MQPDLFEETLKRKLRNLEKRVRWIERDSAMYKAVLQKLYPQKPAHAESRVIQMDMFAG